MMFTQPNARLLCSIAMAAMAMVAPGLGGATEIYRCVDEGGRVTFSQNPCGPKSEAIEIEDRRTPPARAADEARARERAENLDKLVEELEESRAQRLEEGARKRAAREARRQDEAARRARCEHARATLRTLSIQAPVYRLDEEGERVFLDDADRASEILRMRDEIEQFCK